jgi:hypothetical protein
VVEVPRALEEVPLLSSRPAVEASLASLAPTRPAVEASLMPSR